MVLGAEVLTSSILAWAELCLWRNTCNAECGGIVVLCGIVWLLRGAEY